MGRKLRARKGRKRASGGLRKKRRRGTLISSPRWPGVEFRPATYQEILDDYVDALKKYHPGITLPDGNNPILRAHAQGIYDAHKSLNYAIQTTQPTPMIECYKDHLRKSEEEAFKALGVPKKLILDGKPGPHTSAAALYVEEQNRNRRALGIAGTVKLSEPNIASEELLNASKIKPMLEGPILAKARQIQALKFEREYLCEPAPTEFVTHGEVTIKEGEQKVTIPAGTKLEMPQVKSDPSLSHGEVVIKQGEKVEKRLQWDPQSQSHYVMDVPVKKLPKRKPAFWDMEITKEDQKDQEKSPVDLDSSNWGIERTVDSNSMINLQGTPLTEEILKEATEKLKTMPILPSSGVMTQEHPYGGFPNYGSPLHQHGIPLQNSCQGIKVVTEATKDAMSGCVIEVSTIADLGVGDLIELGTSRYKIIEARQDPSGSPAAIAIEPHLFDPVGRGQPIARVLRPMEEFEQACKHVEYELERALSEFISHPVDMTRHTMANVEQAIKCVVRRVMHKSPILGQSEHQVVAEASPTDPEEMVIMIIFHHPSLGSREIMARVTGMCSTLRGAMWKGEGKGYQDIQNGREKAQEALMANMRAGVVGLLNERKSKPFKSVQNLVDKVAEVAKEVVAEGSSHQFCRVEVAQDPIDKDQIIVTAHLMEPVNQMNIELKIEDLVRSPVPKRDQAFWKLPEPKQ